MNNNGMDPALSEQVAREQRLLAAIVFTDVVGFSRLASQNEARVYVALQRDMAVMTGLCRSHGGQVLNTMGDGMLMCFTSAVDAMSCAVEVQRTLHAQSQSLPVTDVLHHRIGVHLGDIILKGDNVFGDGVNVAARLQTEARPDSVCFSSTVYEVVKNKLKFDAKYVGKRQLKNLGEPVQVWEVPPITEATARAQAERLEHAVAAEQKAQEGLSGIKGAALILVSLFLLGGLVFGISKLNVPKQASVRKTRPAAVVPSGVPSTPPAAQAQPAASTPAQMTPDQAAQRSEELKRSYQFAAIVTFLQSEGRVMPDSSGLLVTYGKLAELRGWMEASLLASNAADQVRVDLSSGRAEIYSTPQGPLIQNNGGGYSPLDIQRLSPSDFALLAGALDAWPASQKNPSFADWINAFKAEYPGS